MTNNDNIYMLAAEAAKALHCDPQALRAQAHKDPSKLGFPVCVMGSRVRIPRAAFWAAMRGESTDNVQREMSR